MRQNFYILTWGLFTFDSVSLGPVTLRPQLGASRLVCRVPLTTTSPRSCAAGRVLRAAAPPPPWRDRVRCAHALRMPPVAVRGVPLFRALRR